MTEQFTVRGREVDAPPNTEPLVLRITPGTAPPELIAELLTALSNLQVAYGGTGLEFTIDRAHGTHNFPAAITPESPSL